jgi:ppGpp synthetase/RelA/SpoT-type nucleotidyltranferase
MTNSQVDRFGERLKAGDIEEADLRLLDEYRSSFAAAYDDVIAVIRNRTAYAATGRRVKTTGSIIAKIQRERSRLSQLQDIAGCRIIVDVRSSQDRALEVLRHEFPRSRVVDRREQPSHGYRAVHLIVRSHEKLVEIQLRTLLQHLWAEVSEKLADAIDPAVKYGGGPAAVRARLTELSDLVAEFEALGDEQSHHEIHQRLAALLQGMIDDHLHRGE